MIGRRRRGLGAWTAGGWNAASCGQQDIMPMTQENIDLCAGPGYYLFYPCWACSRAAWQQAQALNAANITPKQEYAPTASNLTPEQLKGQAPIDPTTQAALGVKISQEQVAANIQNQPVIPASDCSNLWTYFTDSTCPVDCSNWWSNYMNSSCPGYVSLQNIGLVTLIGLGVVAVLVLRR